MTYKYLSKENAFLVEDVENSHVRIPTKVAKRIAIFYLKPILTEIGLGYSQMQGQKWELNEIIGIVLTYIRELSCRVDDLEKTTRRQQAKAEEQMQTLFDFVKNSKKV